jgi:hypothetical protein
MRIPVIRSSRGFEFDQVKFIVVYISLLFRNHTRPESSPMNRHAAMRFYRSRARARQFKIFRRPSKSFDSCTSANRDKIFVQQTFQFHAISIDHCERVLSRLEPSALLFPVHSRSFAERRCLKQRDRGVSLFIDRQSICRCTDSDARRKNHACLSNATRGRAGGMGENGREGNRFG